RSQKRCRELSVELRLVFRDSAPLAAMASVLDRVDWPRSVANDVEHDHVSRESVACACARFLRFTMQGRRLCWLRSRPLYEFLFVDEEHLLATLDDRVRSIDLEGTGLQ